MKRQIIGLALCLALVGASSAQALVIDNFDTAQPLIFNPPGGSNSSPPTPPNPLGSIAENGGIRTLSLTGPLTSSAFDLIGGGSFILAAAPGATVTASVTWTPPAPVDLTDGGLSDFLIFGVDSLDHQLSVTVSLTDSAAVTGSNTYLKHNHPIPPDPAGADTLACTGDPSCPSIVGPIYGDVGLNVFGNYYHGLSLFHGGGIDPATDIPFGGAAALDLTSITKIVFSLTTPDFALDFSVDCVYTGSRASTGFTAPLTHTSAGPPPAGALPAGTMYTQTYPTFTDLADGDRNACPASQIPEPASLLLMGTGFLGVGLVGLRTRLLRRRRQQQQA